MVLVKAAAQPRAWHEAFTLSVYLPLISVSSWLRDPAHSLLMPNVLACKKAVLHYGFSSSFFTVYLIVGAQ